MNMLTIKIITDTATALESIFFVLDNRLKTFVIWDTFNYTMRIEKYMLVKSIIFSKNMANVILNIHDKDLNVRAACNLLLKYTFNTTKIEIINK